MRRTLKIAAIVLGALLAVVLVSSIAAHIAVSAYLGKRLDRKVRASFVYANPLTGGVYVRNLHCSDADRDSAFVEAHSLSARINPYALLLRKVSISSVTLNGLALRIVNQDSCFNFSDIPDRFMSDDDEDEKDNGDKPWVVSLGSIALNGTDVRYSHPSRSIGWQIGGFSLTVPGINFDPEHKNAGLTLQLPDGGGSAALGGHYDELTKKFTLTFDADTINPHTLLPIIEQHLGLNDVKALLSAAVTMQGSLDDIMASHISGSLDITRVELRDEPSHMFASCRSMSLKVRDISLKTMQIDVNHLLIDSLTLDIVNTRDGNTLSKLMGRLSANKTENSDSLTYNGTAIDTDQLRVRIGDLNVENGMVVYEDRTLPSKFKYTISDLKALGKEIDTRSTSNHIILNGNLPEGGSLTVNWRGGLNPFKSVCEAQGMLRGVRLRLLSPWTMHIFGYAMQAGTLNFTSDNTIINGKLTTRSRLVILKPEVGKKRKSGKPLIDVPLKLGVGLLKDVDENIVLDVTVSGDLNRSDFHLADELGKAVGQAVKDIILPNQKEQRAKNKEQKTENTRQAQKNAVKQSEQAQSTETQQTKQDKKQLREEKREERRKRREERRQERNR